MSITSVLNSSFVAPVSKPNLGTVSAGSSAPSVAPFTASLADVLTSSATASTPTPSLGALATPRGAAMLGRSVKAAGVPTLSAEDALDLQQSVNLLSQSVEGASGVSAMQHKTTMAILRNLGG